MTRTGISDLRQNRYRQLGMVKRPANKTNLAISGSGKQSAGRGRTGPRIFGIIRGEVLNG